MGIMKVHNAIPCESSLISKQDFSYKLCVLQPILIGKTQPLHDGQEKRGLALTECDVGRVTGSGEFS
jgi:hypothetical protein